MLMSAGLSAGMALEPHAAEEWNAGKTRVLIVSPGARVKIDRPDVRAAIHWQMPSSVEQYCEEALCAGEDGQTAQCVLLHDPEDKARHQRMVEQSHPNRAAVLEILEAVTESLGYEEMVQLQGAPLVQAAVQLLEQQGFVTRGDGGTIRQVPDGPNVNRLDVSNLERRRGLAEERLRAMERYAEARSCRRLELLRYFGEQPPGDWTCSGCDRCREARDVHQAGGLRSAVADGVRELESRRFTLNEMARAILFLAPSHVTRALRGRNEAEVRDLISALLREGALYLDPKGQCVRARR
jgi:ATP-dependent DNA helicase RecQ